MTPASQPEINVFLKAAEQRYAEMGIDPELAGQLFNMQLAKQAQDMGLQAQEPENKASEEGEDQIVMKAAMDRMFELGIPKAKAEQIIRTAVEKQAREQQRQAALSQATTLLSRPHE
jgi:hypothetical protein